LSPAEGVGPRLHRVSALEDESAVCDGSRLLYMRYDLPIVNLVFLEKPDDRLPSG
jgi:hypothetical protein